MFLKQRNFKTTIKLTEKAKELRVSRATFEFICRLVGPAIARRNTRMRDAVLVEKRCTAKMCCGFQNYIFLTPDWLNCSCG